MLIKRGKLKNSIFLFLIFIFIFNSNNIALGNLTTSNEINLIRLSGNDRYQTSVAIAEKVNDRITESVIVASGNSFADSLSASVLAHKLNAPILLVNSTVESSEKSLEYIEKHLSKSGKIYIVGGSGLVDASFEMHFYQIGYSNIIRIGGIDRYETNRLIAEQLKTNINSPVVIASGEDFPDALAISSFAAYNGWPIMLSQKETLPEDIKNYILNIQPSTIYITGGYGAVSKNVELELIKVLPKSKIKRLAGSDRFETSSNIVNEFSSNPQSIYMASGFGYADALAGSALASQNGDPILLIDPSQLTLPPLVESFVSNLEGSNKPLNVIAFGGQSVVPEQLINNTNNLLLGIPQFGIFNQGSQYQKGAYSNVAIQPTDRNWTRQSRFVGPEKPAVKWGTGLYGDVSSASPAISSDGTIYIGADYYDKGYVGQLFAIKQDGSIKWKVELDGQLGESSPVIGKDGTLYIGSESGTFYAFDPNGNIKWKTKVGRSIMSSPAIASDGTLYITSSFSNTTYLFAINPNGTEKWKSDLWGFEFSTDGPPFPSMSTPAIAADGTIYVGSTNGYKLMAFNPDGTWKWKFNTEGRVYSSPLIGEDGTVYIGSADGNLYAVNPDGTEKWSFKTNDRIESSPAISSDGTIYISSYDKHLYAINPNGSEKWSVILDGIPYYSSPLIDSDGTIFIGTYPSRSYENMPNVYAINQDGSIKWAISIGQGVGIQSSPVIGPDGTLYLGTTGQGLISIGSSK